MSEVTPPPPPNAPPPPTLPAAPPTATVPNPPPALADLPLGARLEAVIAAVTAQGLVEVDTDIGRLTLATGFPLPKSGTLQLQVLAKGATPQLLITAIQGLTPQAALRVLGLGAGSAQGTATPARPAAAGTAPHTAPQAGPAAVNLTVGATLVATLLRVGPPAARSAGIPGAAPQAQGAPGQIAGLAPPPTGQPPVAGARGAAPVAQPPGTAQPFALRHGPGAPSGQGAPALPGQATASGVAAAPPPGTLFSIRVVALQPAGGDTVLPQPGGASSLATGSAITGFVIGKAQPSNHPIVQTQAGVLMIATRTPLPVGSAVTFEVLGQTQPAGAAHPTAHAGQPVEWMTDSWPGLREALAALQEANPAAAQQLMQAVLPRPGVMLGANIVFFLAALYGGDLRGWLGDGPARALQRFRPDLLDRLGDDFGRISRIADERGPGEWRSVPIPVYNGADIEQIRLHLKRPDEEDEDREKGRQGTRFVVDVTLSRIGRLQLDGLVYDKEKHMDLIVRTDKRLPAKIETGIRDIFQEAGETTGLKGGLGFQAAPANFVEIAGPARPARPVGLIV